MVCPHAAFEYPQTPSNARLRESIECLVYVIYKGGRHNENVNKTEVRMLQCCFRKLLD